MEAIFVTASANKLYLTNKPVYTVDDQFKQCFELYYEKLVGYAFTIVKENAEAKDLVQSAFIRLWGKKK